MTELLGRISDLEKQLRDATIMFTLVLDTLPTKSATIRLSDFDAADFRQWRFTRTVDDVSGSIEFRVVRE